MKSHENSSGFDWTKKTSVFLRSGKVQNAMVLGVLASSLLICLLWIRWAMQSVQ